MSLRKYLAVTLLALGLAAAACAKKEQAVEKDEVATDPAPAEEAPPAPAAADSKAWLKGSGPSSGAGAIDFEGEDEDLGFFEGDEEVPADEPPVPAEAPPAPAEAPSAVQAQPAEAQRSVRLYVGNLSVNTTGQTIREEFSALGEVTDVHVVLDRDTGQGRGFAFVTMGSPAEAEKAINEMNGKMLDGRPLRVNEAEERAPRGGEGGHGFGGGGGRGGGGRGGGGGGRF